MRIIAGEFRGRKLLPPESDLTRPITDRAKQSLFDILNPLIPDAVVYDCFAGTGSMGLECLSRGAARALFLEADRSAADRLRRNIQTLAVGGRSQVVGGDLFAWFERRVAGSGVRDAGQPGNPNPDAADLLFLDPPYRFLNEHPQKLQQLAVKLVRRHLNPAATVIFRHDAADALALPPLKTYDVRIYGSMMIELLRPEPPTSPASGT
jgi:16S rRNA (guanine966-N2)-methyltransferase